MGDHPGHFVVPLSVTDSGDEDMFFFFFFFFFFVVYIYIYFCVLMLFLFRLVDYVDLRNVEHLLLLLFFFLRCYTDEGFCYPWGKT